MALQVFTVGDRARNIGGPSATHNMEEVVDGHSPMKEHIAPNRFCWHALYTISVGLVVPTCPIVLAFKQNQIVSERVTVGKDL